MTRTLALLMMAGALGAAEPAHITEQYRDSAQKLIAAALDDTEGLSRLQYLCDRIGNRLSGSAALERAIDWAAAEMKKAGLGNVRDPPGKVPHLVRGRESALHLAPVEKPLTMLGLGMSVGTPQEGITSDVVAVSSFDELAALGREKVAGKIGLYNPKWEGYGQTVIYRTSAAPPSSERGSVSWP